MRAKTSDADKFQSWVTSEVLPSIRKTGSYNNNDYNNITNNNDSYYSNDYINNLDKYNGKDCKTTNSKEFVICNKKINS